MKKLLHIRLAEKLLKYDATNIMQERVLRALLDKKAEGLNILPSILITMQLEPTYTFGRRESDESVRSLAAGRDQWTQDAVIRRVPRGGLVTFHGPGQLVAYPLINLQQFQLTPRGYVCLLQKTIIDVLRHYKIRGITTENTGVWISEREKIAAIGVHTRRNITSHGIALNVNTDLAWFDAIVACGLQDKEVTSIAKIRGESHTVLEVADTFAATLANALHLESERATLTDVETLI